MSFCGEIRENTNIFVIKISYPKSFMPVNKKVYKILRIILSNVNRN